MVVYEDQSATLECLRPPDFHGNSYSVSWYKQEISSESDLLLTEKRVLFYQVVLGEVTGPLYEGGLVNRAEYNPETAGLCITNVQISDEHMYVCSNGNLPGTVTIHVYGYSSR